VAWIALAGERTSTKNAREGEERHRERGMGGEKSPQWMARRRSQKAALWFGSWEADSEGGGRIVNLISSRGLINVARSGGPSKPKENLQVAKFTIREEERS